MVEHQQIFAGPLGVRHVMVVVSRLPRARRIRPLRFACFDRGLQMRFQQRHLGVERGLDLGDFDLALRLDLKMDRVVLRLLLLELRLLRGDRGIDLRPRLYREQFGIGRLRWRHRRRMQQLTG
jgi:hypothetical protein